MAEIADRCRRAVRVAGIALLGAALGSGGCRGVPLPSGLPLFGGSDSANSTPPPPAYAEAPPIADAATYDATPSVVPTSDAGANGGGRPPDAAPGEIWCYVHVPPVVETKSETVMIQPARTRRVWVPPVRREVEESVVVEPERRIRVEVPAQFAEQVRRVEVQPRRHEWKQVECQGADIKPSESIGGCWTLAEVPAVFEERTERVQVQPVTWREEVIPARYETRKIIVEVQPGAWREEQDPPQYETRSREVIVSPARWEWRRNDVCELPPGQSDAGARAAAGSDLDRIWGFRRDDEAVPAASTPPSRAPVPPSPAVEPVVRAPTPPAAPTLTTDELIPPSGEMFVDPRAVQTRPPPSVFGDSPRAPSPPLPVPAPAPAPEVPPPSPAPQPQPAPVEPAPNPPSELPPVPQFDD